MILEETQTDIDNEFSYLVNNSIGVDYGLIEVLMYKSIRDANDTLFNLVSNTRGKKVLNIGSNVGTYSIAFLENCNQVHLLEPNVMFRDFSFRRIIKRGFNSGFTMLDPNYNLMNNYYDLVVCNLDYLDVDFYKVTKTLKLYGLLYINKEICDNYIIDSYYKRKDFHSFIKIKELGADNENSIFQ